MYADLHLLNSAFSPYTPGLQIAWDSTSMGELKTCPRKYQLSIIEGWQPRELSIHLAFGLGYHSALEHYDHARARGESHEDGVRAAVREAMRAMWDSRMGRPVMSEEPTKTRTTLVRSVVWWLEQFKNDPIETVILANGKPAVELSFRFPLATQSPADGPYLWCGHMDRVGKLGTEHYIVDKKTTKHALDQRYFAQFTPHNQFSGYILAGKVAYGLPIAGLIVDAAQVGVTFSRFAREVVSRTSDQLAEWVKDLGFWLRQAEFYATQGHWPMNDKACLAGDTIVTVSRGRRKGWKMTIAELHTMLKQKNGSRIDESIQTLLLSDVGGYVSNQTLLDIFATGVKPVFKLTTGFGSIKATADHRFNTPAGWKRLDELKAGDCLLLWNGRQFWLGRSSGKTRKQISCLKFYPRGSSYPPYGAKQRVHILTAEASLNGLSLVDFVQVLRTNKARSEQFKYLSDDVEVHHKDGNELNDDPLNLEVLYKADHKKQHDMGKTVNKLRTTIIHSIEPAGSELVYDIAMEGPHHNFIANGLVAHNCDMYGGCQFRAICAKSPASRDVWLKGAFAKRVWNPLIARGDI